MSSNFQRNSSKAAGIGPINWARYATAIASSQSYQQGAYKAIDNLIDGYKTSGGDPWDEWASNRGGNGTTLTLTWPSPVTLSSLVLWVTHVIFYVEETN